MELSYVLTISPWLRAVPGRDRNSRCFWLWAHRVVLIVEAQVVLLRGYRAPGMKVRKGSAGCYPPSIALKVEPSPHTCHLLAW